MVPLPQRQKVPSEMWIVSNKGFMSVVAKGRDGKASPPGLDVEISVRFRRPADAAKLFPGHEVVKTPDGDYACRVFATRAEVAEVMFRETVGINYTNFKSSIPHADTALSSAAHRAWDVFGKLQDGGPYGRDVPYEHAPWGRRVHDEAWRLDLPVPAKSARAKVQKAKVRKDPFCDGCGMRFGIKNLDADGYCAECAGALDDPAVRTEVDPIWEPALDEPNAGGPGECWNCATAVAERNRWKLCEECAGLYTDTDAELLDTIVAGMDVE